jgi:hypothetical protein
MGNFSKALSQLGKRDGVNVNVIHPGATETERFYQLIEQRSKASGKSVEQLKQEATAKDGLRRLGKAEDVAGLCLFLCSEKARHIQGTAIAVDGGSTVGYYRSAPASLHPVAILIICRCSKPATCLVILVFNMRSFVQNEVQEGLLNLHLAVVFDQTQLSKLVHEKIHAAPGRANYLSEGLLVHQYGYRVRTKVVAIVGQQQKSPCQPHLAGIEQLVDQVCFNSGGPGQKMAEKVVGKFRILMQQADKSFRL